MTKHIPYQFIPLAKNEMAHRAQSHYAFMDQRRSIRSFAHTPVPRGIIEHIIMTASTAPSGAHKQPWTFVAISDPTLKQEIRKAAEAEEYENYHGRMNSSWLKDLEVFETDWKKPFLEIAPWLIIVFKKVYDYNPQGKQPNYYVNESVGIATGLLISAIHHAGLVTLTHTPSPMNFLQRILDRPDNERPYLLLPVGYPAADAKVPQLRRKSLDEMSIWL